MPRLKPKNPTHIHLTNEPSDESLFVGRLRAANLLDVSYQLIDKLIKDGAVRSYKFGRRILIKREDLLRVVERNEVR